MSDPFGPRLDQARAQGLLRRLRDVDSAQGRAVILDGRKVILFCSNNYLGLCAHPRLTQAAAACARRYGWGAGAARLVAGSMTPHRELELATAKFLGKEAALLFNSGYAANTGILTALLGKRDHVFADRLIHASVIDGARHSGARLTRFFHNDPAALESALKKAPAKGIRLVVTEGVFSMEGDIPPLMEMAMVAKKHGALFMVDDAHGFGVFGPQGRGTVHEADAQDMVDIHVVTFGKALGGFGGLVAAKANLIEGLINFSRPFIYSTALPPAVAACALEAMEIVRGEEGEVLRANLRQNVIRAKAVLKSAGNSGKLESHILPLVTGESAQAAALSARLLENGIFAPAIRPPTVPKGAARLRFSIMSEHTEDDFQALQAALAF